MAIEYSPGTFKPWHGKWLGILNWRNGSDDKWHKKTKVLTCYHGPDSHRVGVIAEIALTQPTGRITKRMEEEARLALKEWRDELVGRPARVGDEDATVAQYVTHYLDTMEASKAIERSSLAAYRQLSKVIARMDIGALALDELRAEDAEAWIAQMVGDGRADSTVRKVFNLLNGSLKHAVRSKRLPHNPLEGVKTPKVTYKEPNSLTPSSRAKLVSYLDVAGETPVNVGISIALYTGMREGEICGLRWKDVDLERGVIHVRNVIAREDNRCYEKEPKTRHGMRDIPVPPELAATLKRRALEAKLECADLGVRFAGELYVVGTISGGTGAWMHPHALWRDWKALAKSLGLAGMRGKVPTFHDLRHTYATVAVHMPGTNLKGVQLNLGHSSIKTTMDIYASDDPEARRDVAAATASAMREAPRGADVLLFRPTGTEG